MKRQGLRRRDIDRDFSRDFSRDTNRQGANGRGERRSAFAWLPLALAFVTSALATPASADTVAADPQPQPLATIEKLDVSRYMGTWYEIARFGNRFQRQCVGHVTAQYTARPNGTVAVVNRCRKQDGTTDEADGVARSVGSPDSPKLEVRFVPVWLSFIPMVWGDYWVIDLDPDYKLAAVSEPGRKYLWILSRTPHVEREAYQALLGRLAQSGFDLTRLETTPQD
ncbi:apolipoprotein D and lipocalin family protein [Cupriavidus sp. YR651]|uniref:lipocalin family protein n=1 Tax=Cupriavidus sp. YR651 TaxID=1855315 RepID=UPI000885FA11|nr:lipocalin family protein [Cupriavidus sp. YR651]SDC72375.1 apolipoprotein D and lipocalin family protein [Cupriavidus sp. YR651]